MHLSQYRVVLIRLLHILLLQHKHHSFRFTSMEKELSPIGPVKTGQFLLHISLFDIFVWGYLNDMEYENTARVVKFMFEIKRQGYPQTCDNKLHKGLNLCSETNGSYLEDFM